MSPDGFFKMSSTMTTNEILKSLGYTTEPSAKLYQNNVLEDGHVVFTGTVFSVNAWIRNMTEDQFDDLRC
jgi:hypothetical protein